LHFLFSWSPLRLLFTKRGGGLFFPLLFIYAINLHGFLLMLLGCYPAVLYYEDSPKRVRVVFSVLFSYLEAVAGRYFGLFLVFFENDQKKCLRKMRKFSKIKVSLGLE